MTVDNKIVTVVDWILTEKCNLNCYYCLQNADTRNAECKPISTEFLKQVHQPTLFHLTGGEPFLIPNLTDIVNNIQDSGHYVSMNTNLTRSVQEFTNHVKTDKFLFMNASYHYVYRKMHITPFVRNYMNIRNIGIFIYASLVMIPHLIDELGKVAQMLISQGVFVVPKLMRGRENGKDYPQNYTSEHLRKINDILEMSKATLSPQEIAQFAIACKYNISIDDWQLGSHSVGTRCFDGKNYIRITEKGDLVYCNGLTLGNIYSKEQTFVHGTSKLECPYKTNNNLCKMNY